MKNVSLHSVVSRLGAIIVFPVILLVPIAVFLDRSYGTLPWITIGSLGLSACISTVFVVRLIKT